MNCTRVLSLLNGSLVWFNDVNCCKHKAFQRFRNTVAILSHCYCAHATLWQQNSYVPPSDCSTWFAQVIVYCVTHIVYSQKNGDTVATGMQHAKHIHWLQCRGKNKQRETTHMLQTGKILSCCCFLNFLRKAGSLSLDLECTGAGLW